MPDDMREFVDRRTRDGGYSTPTEYVRSLIRSDRQQAQRSQFEPLIQKWFAQGQLSAEEEASLPPGMLDRARQSLEKLLIQGINSGVAVEGSSEFWQERRSELQRRLKKQAP